MEWLVALAVLVGVVGVVVPILPGLLLVALAVAWWAAAHQAWWLLALVVALACTATAAKYALPARAARDSASTPALAVGALAALVGFFMLPVIGMIVGFLVGVLVSELIRRRDLTQAWRATRESAKAIGLGMAVELAAAIAIAGAWVAALLVR